MASPVREGWGSVVSPLAGSGAGGEPVASPVSGVCGSSVVSPMRRVWGWWWCLFCSLGGGVCGVPYGECWGGSGLAPTGGSGGVHGVP